MKNGATLEVARAVEEANGVRDAGRSESRVPVGLDEAASVRSDVFDSRVIDDDVVLTMVRVFVEPCGDVFAASSASEFGYADDCVSRDAGMLEKELEVVEVHRVPESARDHDARTGRRQYLVETADRNGVESGRARAGRGVSSVHHAINVQEDDLHGTLLFAKPVQTGYNDTPLGPVV